MTDKPGHLHVAAAQYPLDALGSMEAWAGKVARWVADGVATGAQLLVFPEYGVIEVAATRGAEALAEPGDTLHAVADAQAAIEAVWRGLARRHRVHILAPSGPERRGDGFVNAARIYTPGGTVGVQDKLILTPFERSWGLVPGRGQCVFDTAVGRIGIAICYDSEFPLLVRALAEAGADLILIPACTEHLSGHHRVRCAAMARALESQIATVTSPTVGEAPWSRVVDRNTGSAAVFVPPDVAMSATGVLAEGVIDAPGWVSCAIDLAALARLREVGEVRNWQDWGAQTGLEAAVLVVRLDVGV